MTTHFSRRITAKTLVAATVALMVFARAPLEPLAQEAEDFEAVEITTRHVRGNIYALFGLGGNIGVSVGEDGIFLIDDQFAPLTPKILAAIRKIDAGAWNDKPIRFVINTHWHQDHVDGNENMAGLGAAIIAHDNARARLAAGLKYEEFGVVVPPAATNALPILTFSSEMSLHLNGAEARIIHIPHAHTDGDALIWFPGLNVIHAGDAFITQGYPLIDYPSGGSIGGLLAGWQRAYDLADEDTIIIPGHGELASKADIRRYLDILTTIRDRVAAKKNDGASLEEVIASHPTLEWDEGYTNPYVSGDLLTQAIFMTLDGPLADSPPR